MMRGIPMITVISACVALSGCGRHHHHDRTEPLPPSQEIAAPGPAAAPFVLPGLPEVRAELGPNMRVKGVYEDHGKLQSVEGCFLSNPSASSDDGQEYVSQDERFMEGGNENIRAELLVKRFPAVTSADNAFTSMKKGFECDRGKDYVSGGVQYSAVIPIDSPNPGIRWHEKDITKHLDTDCARVIGRYLDSIAQVNVCSPSTSPEFAALNLLGVTATDIYR